MNINGEFMKKLILGLFIVGSAGAWADGITCFEKISCASYNDGKSNLIRATSEEHAKSKAVADYVYVKSVYFVKKGKELNRIVETGIKDLWFVKIESSYIYATNEQHTQSAQENYDLAQEDCKTRVENVIWKYGMCK